MFDLSMMKDVKTNGVPSKWITVGEPDKRTLVFDPTYPVEDSMRWRIVNAQFVDIMDSVTHWVFLD